MRLTSKWLTVEATAGNSTPDATTTQAARATRKVCLTATAVEHDEPDARRAVQIDDGNASSSERDGLFIERDAHVSNEENVKPRGITGATRDDESSSSNVVEDRNEV
jgi:hypothetical protein